MCSSAASAWLLQTFHPALPRATAFSTGAAQRSPKIFCLDGVENLPPVNHSTVLRAGTDAICIPTSRLKTRSCQSCVPGSSVTHCGIVLGCRKQSAMACRLGFWRGRPVVLRNTSVWGSGSGRWNLDWAKTGKARARAHSVFCFARPDESRLACGATGVDTEGWHDGDGVLLHGNGSGSRDFADSFDSPDRLLDISQVEVDALEAGAFRAIQQAERQCRQAAQKLLEAQSRLESARLAAVELRAVAGTGKPSTEAEAAVEELSGSCIPAGIVSEAVDVITPVEQDEDDTWRDGVNAVEAVVRAEEQRRAKLDAFQRASDVLRQRLTEAPMQVTINDRHIEFMDRGGQYHVASWVINEVEGFWSQESGEYGLAVNINLELALQGCDPQTANFLQELPYDQVLGIKASPDTSSPVLVDYWDGSSWETDCSEGAWSGVDSVGSVEVVWGGFSDKTWTSPPGLSSLNVEAFGATEVDFDMACPITVDYEGNSYRSADSPLSTHVVLEYRDGQICRAEEELTLVDPSKLQFPGSSSASMVQLPVAPPTSLAMLKEPKPQPLFRKGEALACLGVCAYVAGVMVKTCELSTLLIDAYVLFAACTIGLTMACAVGVITPTLPPALSKLLGKGPGSAGSSWRAREPVRRGSRPWEQVVFWMGMGAAVLSTATITAVVVKALQAASSFAYQTLARLLAPLMSSGSLSLAIPRQVVGYVGYMTASRFVVETLPYLASALAWMLLLLSIGVATASVSLILISFTGRPRLPQLGP